MRGVLGDPMKNKMRLCGEEISWKIVGDELHVDCSKTGITAIVTRAFAEVADNAGIKFHNVVLNGPIRLNNFEVSKKNKRCPTCQTVTTS